MYSRDVRNKEGVRYQVWIDSRYFAVNEDTVFDDIKTVCHDKRYFYRRLVSDGEIIKLDVEWTECQSLVTTDTFKILEKEQKGAKTLKKKLKKEQERKKAQKGD